MTFHQAQALSFRDTMRQQQTTMRVVQSVVRNTHGCERHHRRILDVASVVIQF